MVLQNPGRCIHTDRKPVLKSWRKIVQNYVIYMDASGDIDPAFAAENNIKIVPMNYTLGDEELLCSQMESPEVLHKYYETQRRGSLTHTSQITPGKYISIFSEELKKGIGVLYISLSSGLTQTYDSACLAARELAEDYPDVPFCPVNSLAATGGMGLLTEAAVLNRSAGMSVEENAQDLRALADRLCHFFMVDDLMYLKRGGRIPATTALLGSALNIKPILTIDPVGKLISINKKRGVKTALKELALAYKTHRDPALEKKYGSRIYIMHGDAEALAVTEADLIRQYNPDARIHIMGLSPVIGAHTGPGMIAVIFYGTRVSG